jgi:predicted permease
MATRLHHRVWTALRSFFGHRAAERELDDELRFHFEQMQAYEAARAATHAATPTSTPNTPANAPANDVYLRTRRRFGGFDQVKEACRDMRTLRPLEEFLKDLRFGARMLVRGPVFSIVAILSLALGIGATSAIFSLINAIVLRELPVEKANELYLAQSIRRDEVNTRFSWLAFKAGRDMTAGRAEMAAASSIRSMQLAPTTAGSATPQPESGRVQLVSGEYFGLLRQRPQVGRLLERSDNEIVGQHPVAVISDAYWTRKFGRATDVAGRGLMVNGVLFTIIGVTQPGFFGTTVEARHPDVFLPVMMQANVRYNGNMSVMNGDASQPWVPQREVAWLQWFIRMPESAVPAVTQALNLTMQRDRTQMSGYKDDEGVRRILDEVRMNVASGARGISNVRNNLTTPLVVLLVMVGLLLLIACANIASLLLARATNRHREMAIRLSIGAGRGRLVRQLLTESLLLAFIGGALGLIVAEWGSVALVAFAEQGSRPPDFDVSPDWRVVAFTLTVTLITGLLFGLMPAFRSTHVALAETLKSQTRSVIGASGGPGRMPLAKLLIAGQMAFSLLLLIVAALFTRSLQQMTRVDVGFDRDRVLMVSMDPRAGGYEVRELPELYRRITERIAAVPGVTSVSVSANGVFGGGRSISGMNIQGYTPGRDENVTGDQDVVGNDYFRTVGLSIVAGRAFGPEDTATSRKVSIINEATARRYFKNRNPIGQRWNYDDDLAAGYEIVGVVRDARYTTVKGETPNMVYRPAVQTAEYYLGSLEVRTDGNPAALVTDVRNALRHAEPRLPVAGIDTLDARIARTMGGERLMMWLTMAFGAMALFLACLGLYGTISYAVTRRTAELGVRMALGAGRGTVQMMILREAFILVAAGLVIGIPLAFLAARALSTLLFGVAPTDVVATGSAVATMVLIAALAAYLPARRASRVDPMLALRAE